MCRDENTSAQEQKDGSFWYAIRVRAKSEIITSNALRQKGYEEFVPLYHSRRKWSDRIKDVEAPLFPGYVFCRFDPLQRLLPILTIPRVVHIVGAGKSPLPIAEEEIASIRSVVSVGLDPQPWPFLDVGRRVRLERGPLSGIEGIVIQVGTKNRLIVSVELLQRSVAVEIDRSWVSPLSVGPDWRLVSVSEVEAKGFKE